MSYIFGGVFHVDFWLLLLVFVADGWTLPTLARLQPPTTTDSRLHQLATNNELKQKISNSTASRKNNTQRENGKMSNMLLRKILMPIGHMQCH